MASGEGPGGRFILDMDQEILSGGQYFLGNIVRGTIFPGGQFFRGDRISSDTGSRKVVPCKWGLSGSCE